MIPYEKIGSKYVPFDHKKEFALVWFFGMKNKVNKIFRSSDSYLLYLEWIQVDIRNLDENTESKNVVFFQR